MAFHAQLIPLGALVGVSLMGIHQFLWRQRSVTVETAISVQLLYKNRGSIYIMMECSQTLDLEPLVFYIYVSLSF